MKLHSRGKSNEGTHVGVPISLSQSTTGMGGGSDRKKVSHHDPWVSKALQLCEVEESLWWRLLGCSLLLSVFISN